jgi:protein-tyrosine phosphatase
MAAGNETRGRGFIDLHCHWIHGIDDGARDATEALMMLQALQELGFDTVIATPHMRPGLWDNKKPDLEAAFERAKAELPDDGVPQVALSSEHYFDHDVFSRVLAGEGLPYPGNKAVLLEFYDQELPPSLGQRFFELRVRKRLRPVIAHPERYRKIWSAPEVLETLIQAGAVTLLDAAALVGKYGSRPQRCAELLLERGLYHAACSDAHRPDDVAQVAAAMKRIEELYGPDEVQFLFGDGPREILEGRAPE